MKTCLTVIVTVEILCAIAGGTRAYRKERCEVRVYVREVALFNLQMACSLAGVG
jgi:small basic protein